LDRTKRSGVGLKMDFDLKDKMMAEEGYGGYYDCVECLRVSALHLADIFLNDEHKRESYKAKIEEQSNIINLERAIAALIRFHLKEEEKSKEEGVKVKEKAI